MMNHKSGTNAPVAEKIEQEQEQGQGQEQEQEQEQAEEEKEKEEKESMWVQESLLRGGR